MEKIRIYNNGWQEVEDSSIKEAWAFGIPGEGYRLAATKEDAGDLLMYYYRDGTNAQVWKWR